MNQKVQGLVQARSQLTSRDAVLWFFEFAEQWKVV